jgi:Flp pilus assembly protein TadD
MPASNRMSKPDPAQLADRLFLHGVQCHRQQQHEAACRAMERALALQPDHPDATLWSGILAFHQGQLGTAITWFRRAVRLDPNMASAYYNLGLCLQESGDIKGALTAYDQAITLQPDKVEAYNNRGMLLAELGDYGRACANYQIAIACKPDYLDAWFNRGVARAAQGQFQLAGQDYQAVVARDPGHAAAQFALAIVWLTLGHWAAGWPQYEWRWHYPAVRLCKPETIAPPWDGQSSLVDKHLLLDAEQGLGDTLQFCRYIQPLQRLGAHITLRLPTASRPLLMPLLEAMPSPCDVLPATTWVNCDYQLSLMSIPALLGTTPENIPGHAGYLQVPESYRLRWQKRLGPKGETPRIGLVWAGNPHHNNDAHRSLPLRQLLSALPVGYQYLVLQKTVRPEDQAPLASRDDIDWLGNELLDFADTAAVCSQLDVVISVDTAVAHLAGGLGVPVWLLLPQVPDWRWQLHGETTPWYDSARLFRQEKQGHWSGVLNDIWSLLSQYGVHTQVEMSQPRPPHCHTGYCHHGKAAQCCDYRRGNVT